MDIHLIGMNFQINKNMAFVIHTIGKKPEFVKNQKEALSILHNRYGKMIVDRIANTKKPGPLMGNTIVWNKKEEWVKIRPDLILLVKDIIC